MCSEAQPCGCSLRGEHRALLVLPALPAEPTALGWPRGTAPAWAPRLPPARAAADTAMELLQGVKEPPAGPLPSGSGVF